MGASRELWPDEYTVFNILYDKFLFWSIVVGLFTFAWLLIAVLRYRDGIEPAGKEVLEVGVFPKERHNFDLEFAWFLGPTILVMWVTFLAFGSMNIVWGEVEKLQQEETFTVEVNGLQWYWDFYYMDNLTWEDDTSIYDVTWNSSGLTIDMSDDSMATSATILYGWGTQTRVTLDLANNTTLDESFREDTPFSVDLHDSDGFVIHRWQHIPAPYPDPLDPEVDKYTFKTSGKMIIPCDENVLFNIHSMNPARESNFDASNIYQGVQHAFWLQEWGVKEDAVPGLDGGTWMYAQPNEAGIFPIRCAEYCGDSHSLMGGEVEVVAREEVGSCDADFGVYFDHKEALD